MTSTFNFGTDILSRETVVYIDPTFVSRCQRKVIHSEMMYFLPRNNFTSVIVSLFASIESCSVYGIGMGCKTCKNSALGSSMLIFPSLR